MYRTASNDKRRTSVISKIINPLALTLVMKYFFLTSKDLEPIPKKPLRQVEISSVKKDKDIFKSKNFLKWKLEGVPVACIERGQSALSYVNIRTLETLIRWLSENSHAEWESMRDKMSVNFAKKTGDERKAVELYSAVTMVDSTANAIAYLMALKEAKAALCD